MATFLTTAYAEVPAKGTNPARYEADATGHTVGRGGSASFGDRSYTVELDGSIRHVGRERMSKKARLKARRAAKAALATAPEEDARAPVQEAPRGLAAEIERIERIEDEDDLEQEKELHEREARRNSPKGTP